MSLTVGFYLQPTAKERFVHEFRVEAITDFFYRSQRRRVCQSDREAANRNVRSSSTQERVPEEERVARWRYALPHL